MLLPGAIIPNLLLFFIPYHTYDVVLKKDPNATVSDPNARVLLAAPPPKVSGPPQ